MSFVLGINNCFAVKRWPSADEWAPLIAEELGLDVVQHSLDLVDFTASDDELREHAGSLRTACSAAGVTVHSTFTGLIAYSANLLLDPDPIERARAFSWYERVIEYTAWCGAGATGGHLGSLSVTDVASAEHALDRWSELAESLHRLRRVAHARGLETLLVENMACAREPSTRAQMASLVRPGNGDRVSMTLCLDIGHQCVPGTEGDERDPYVWLRELGDRTSVVHLQQTDAESDHHWPFTERYNALGRIAPERVLEALGDARPTLIIEVIPSFEADDDQVLADLRETVDQWRAALADAAAIA